MAEASSADVVGSPPDLEDVMEAGVAVEDFINTGRTGRRNAVPDITDSHMGTVSTAGLDFSLDKLCVGDPKSPTPGPSTPSPSTSKSNGTAPDSQKPSS